MKQPIIAVDMDGVLIEYNHTKVIPALNAAGYDITYEEIDSFKYEETVGLEGCKIALEIINSPEIYDGLEPEPGALEGLLELRSLGRVLIVTHSLPKMADAKLDWLYSHGIEEADVVMVKDKRLVQADLLIDDALHNVEPWIATGRPAVVFGRPWNRDWARPDLAPRAVHWEEVPRMVHDQLQSYDRPETILEEAGRLVDRGARQQDYGHPKDNYEALAQMVNALFARKLRRPIDAMDTIRFMAALKLVRDAARTKRDNWVDLAGYARVGERVAAAEDLWNEGAAP